MSALGAGSKGRGTGPALAALASEPEPSLKMKEIQTTKGRHLPEGILPSSCRNRNKTKVASMAPVGIACHKQE